MRGKMFAFYLYFHMSPDFVPNCLNFWICHLFKINKNSLKTFKSCLSVLKPQLPFLREICKLDSPLPLCWVVNHINFLMAGVAPWLRQGWQESSFEVSFSYLCGAEAENESKSFQWPFLRGGRRICQLEGMKLTQKEAEGWDSEKGS